MRRKEREVVDNERIDAIIRKNKILRLGLNDQGETYIVPLNFGFAYKSDKRYLYFHSAPAGRKVELLRQNPNVSFEMDCNFEVLPATTACAYSAQYQSVMGQGVVKELTDNNDKLDALQILMKSLTGQSDFTFNPKSVERVTVFEIEVTCISCKEHLAE